MISKLQHPNMGTKVVQSFILAQNISLPPKYQDKRRRWCVNQLIKCELVTRLQSAHAETCLLNLIRDIIYPRRLLIKCKIVQKIYQAEDSCLLLHYFLTYIRSLKLKVGNDMTCGQYCVSEMFFNDCFNRNRSLLPSRTP